MPKRSSTGLTGVHQSIMADTGDLLVRVADAAGRRVGQRFPCPKGYVVGKSVLPAEARLWALAKLREFGEGATANKSFFSVMALEWATMNERLGQSKSRLTRVRHLARLAPEHGFDDMTSEKFGANLLAFLEGIRANWWDPDGTSPFRRKRRLAISDSSRNELLSYVRCVINYAMNHSNPSHRLGRNPLLRKSNNCLRKFAVKETVKAVFQVDELRAMVSDANRHHKDKVLGLSMSDEDPWWLLTCLWVYTGTRAQEGAHLRWEFIDWEGRSILLKQMKDEHGRDIFAMKKGERVIPLMDELFEILRQRRVELFGQARPHGWIIANDNMRSNGAIQERKRTKKASYNYSPRFYLYLKRCGIVRGERVPHSVRHNYVSLRRAMGDDFADIQLSVGHDTDDGDITELYGRARQQFLAAVKDWHGQFRLRAPLTAVHPIRVIEPPQAERAQGRLVEGSQAGDHLRAAVGDADAPIPVT